MKNSNIVLFILFFLVSSTLWSNALMLEPHESMRINAFGICSEIVNNGVTGKKFFVPTKTKEEMISFLSIFGKFNSNECSKIGCNRRLIKNCDVHETVNGTYDGTCKTGTTGKCQYRCSNNEWIEYSNNCKEINPVLINGRCGGVNNECHDGKLEDVSDTDDQYRWKCLGQNGGADKSCIIPKVKFGTWCHQYTDVKKCSKVGKTIDTSDALCNVGESGYLWDSQCQKYRSVPGNSFIYKCQSQCAKMVNGECGEARNSCNSGILSELPNKHAKHFWKCNGYNGGVSALCKIRIQGYWGVFKQIGHKSCSSLENCPLPCKKLRENNCSALGAHSICLEYDKFIPSEEFERYMMVCVPKN